MSKMKFIVFIMCIVLGAVGCTSGGIINQVPKLEGEGNFYVEVQIPAGLQASSIEGQGVVSAQGMVNLTQMKFRVRNVDNPKIELTRTVDVTPESESVIAAFRLSNDKWYLEIIGLNEEGVVILRDQQSLAYWRVRRNSEWKSHADGAFPSFIEDDKFYGKEVQPPSSIKTVDIKKDEINKVDNMVLDFEPGYVYVIVDVDDWKFVDGSSITLEQPGRALPYKYSGELANGSFHFRKQINFYHIPMGGWVIKADLEVEKDGDTRNLTTSQFIEIYGGETQVIKFSGGNNNLIIGEE